MMKRGDEFLTEAAETFKAKNAIYGDNWKMVGEVMVGLFPNGVSINSADDWNRMHILLLKVVKMTRYTNNWSGGGHADSIRDDAVYSAMLEAIDAEIAGRPKPVSGEKFIHHICATCDRHETCKRSGVCQQQARLPGLKKTSA